MTASTAGSTLQVVPGASAVASGADPIRAIGQKHAGSCYNPHAADRRAPPRDPRSRSTRDGKVVASRARRRARRLARTRFGATCASSPPAASSSACTAARFRPRPAAASFAQRLHVAPEAKAAPRRGRAAAARDRERAPARRRRRPTLELARRLPPERDCTVLTNSPPVAAALADHPRAEVVLIGGRLLKDAQVTVGAAAVDAIRQVRADACVLGICSLHPELGVTADRPRRGARQARDGAGLGRGDRARHRRQAAHGEPVVRGAARRASPTS